jgi:ABC-type uncharacterized transport system permease subunit
MDRAHGIRRVFVGWNKNRATAGAVTGLDVAEAVADHPGLGQVEIHFAGGAEEHAGVGFAVFVLAVVGRDGAFGVIRTEIDGVDLDGVPGELAAKFGVDFFEAFVSDFSAGDGGLVCYDDELVAGVA